VTAQALREEAEILMRQMEKLLPPGVHVTAVFTRKGIPNERGTPIEFATLSTLEPERAFAAMAHVLMRYASGEGAPPEKLAPTQ
jgi:hypothetical protein